MRKVTKPWPYRIRLLVLSGSVLSGSVLSGSVLYWTAATASILLPLTGVLMLSGIMLYSLVLDGTAPLLFPRTPVRIRVLVVSGIVLSGIVLDGTAYTLLPRTADGVSVTVLQCAPVQPVQDSSMVDCQGTTIFRRTFTDEATVAAVHATLVGWREVMVVQYWRSFEDLERFARSADELHFPAWKRFNARVGYQDSAVGIWHESFLVPAGQYECLYDNLPVFGLAAATRHVPARGQLETARRRLGGQNEPAVPTPADA